METPHAEDPLSLVADTAEERDRLQRMSRASSQRWSLSKRQMGHLELLLTGAYAPLRGYLGHADYHSVLERCRLSNGVLWPIPIVLDVDREIEIGTLLTLQDQFGNPLAIVEVESCFRADFEKECTHVFGRYDTKYENIRRFVERRNPWYIGGAVHGFANIQHFDHLDVRYTPAQLRKRIRERGWRKVVAFQTRNVLHKSHFYIASTALKRVGQTTLDESGADFMAGSEADEDELRKSDAGLLIQPTIAPTRVGDIDPIVRVHCYRAVMDRFGPSAMLSLIELPMKLAGPREAMLHCLVRKNYGATHMIIGRDHAGYKDLYKPREAQQFVMAHAREMGMHIVTFGTVSYFPEEKAFKEKPGGLNVSGTLLRSMLQQGEPVPSWFTFPEVVNELNSYYKPLHARGHVILFTGLSASGKTTLARSLEAQLSAEGKRVVLLDGDVLRRIISPDLGFSKKDRDTHWERLAYIATMIAAAGGVAIISAIAPFHEQREAVHDRVLRHGRGALFTVIYVSTPISVCIQRDPKGLYKKAFNGELQRFTGVDHPYEEPRDANLVIDTSLHSIKSCRARLWAYFRRHGYLHPKSSAL